MIGLRLLKCYSSAPLSLPQSKPRTPHESIVRVGFAKLPNGVFYSLTKLSCNYSFSETSVGLIQVSHSDLPLTGQIDTKNVPQTICSPLDSDHHLTPRCMGRDVVGMGCRRVAIPSIL